MWPPDSVNSSPTPNSASAATASVPPCPSVLRTTRSAPPVDLSDLCTSSEGASVGETVTVDDVDGEVAPRRWRPLLLRIAGSLVMLGVLIWKLPDVDVDELVPEWTSSTGWWLLGAAALTFAAIVLSSMRWQAVLTALGVRSHLGHLLNHYLAGQFVSNVLPTTIGGDVLRVSRLSREN